MAYRGAVIEQQWTKEEMDAYWAERIEGKRLAHVMMRCAFRRILSERETCSV